MKTFNWEQKKGSYSTGDEILLPNGKNYKVIGETKPYWKEVPDSDICIYGTSHTAQTYTMMEL